MRHNTRVQHHDYTTGPAIVAGSEAEALYLLDVAEQFLAVAQDAWQREMALNLFLQDARVSDARVRVLTRSQRRWQQSAWLDVEAGQAMVAAAAARVAHLRTSEQGASDDDGNA